MCEGRKYVLTLAGPVCSMLAGIQWKLCSIIGVAGAAIVHFKINEYCFDILIATTGIEASLSSRGSSEVMCWRQSSAEFTDPSKPQIHKSLAYITILPWD